MLTVTQANYIKEMREKKGMSIAKIAETTGVCWSTAKKYADEEVDFAKKPRQRRKRGVMDGFEEYVDAWVEENLLMPAKGRITAKAMYEALLELGFAGSYRTVRHYAREAKQRVQEKNAAAVEQFIRLEHPPGEAQVDFGEFESINPLKPAPETLYHLVMDIPQSNRRISRVLPGQNSECLFYGLQSMFHELQGVPPFIVFDNLSPVVSKIVSNSKRELTDGFIEFQRIYGFQSQFAAPGKGHEKGAVENAVQYVRNNYLKPAPEIEPTQEGFEAFNENLQRRMDPDQDTIHYRKKVTVRELWNADKAALRGLPDTDYVPQRKMTRRVNKYGEIAIDKDRYHIPTAHPGQSVFVQLTWCEVIVYDAYGERLLATLPRTYVHKTRDIDWINTLKVYEHRPRAIEQGLQLKALPVVVRQYLLPEALAERRSRVQTVLALLAEHSILEVEKALTRAAERNITGYESIRVLAQSLEVPTSAAPVVDVHSPQEIKDWNPNPAVYDTLLSTEVVV